MSLFQEGPDRTRHLVGITTIPDRWEIVFRRVLNQNQISQVYLADRSTHIIYPLKHQVIPWEEAENIPTAIGDQYYPVLAEDQNSDSR